MKDEEARSFCERASSWRAWQLAPNFDRVPEKTPGTHAVHGVLIFAHARFSTGEPVGRQAWGSAPVFEGAGATPTALINAGTSIDDTP